MLILKYTEEKSMNIFFTNWNVQKVKQMIVLSREPFLWWLLIRFFNIDDLYVKSSFFIAFFQASTAKRKLERLQFSTSSSFFKI